VDVDVDGSGYNRYAPIPDKIVKLKQVEAKTYNEQEN
jgi:hypothetical protein